MSQSLIKQARPFAKMITSDCNVRPSIVTIELQKSIHCIRHPYLLVKLENNVSGNYTLHNKHSSQTLPLANSLSALSPTVTYTRPGCYMED